MQSIGMDFSFELAKAWPYFAPNMYLSPAMLPDYPQSSAGMDQNSMQVQQLHLVQNPHAQAGFTGYGPAFVASPPFMQTEYPMQYGMQYGVHYGLQPAEKPAPAPSQEHVPASRDSDGPPAKAARTKKTGEKNGTSTYASRHQAAESRRRQRINDRLDALRKVVPHRDRANTAAFLEEVISYVLGLKKRLSELEGIPEADLQVPLVDTQPVLAGEAVAVGSAAPPSTVVGNPTASTSAPAQQGAEAGVGPTAMGGPVPMGGVPMPGGAILPHMMPALRDMTMGGQADTDTVTGLAKGLNTSRGLPATALGANPNQVLVPVAIVQPDQGAVGGQAYMCLNREDLKDFPMLAGQGMMMPGVHMPTVVDSKQTGQDGEHLMDVLAGAANCVAVGQAMPSSRHREEVVDEEEDVESKAVEKQPLTTRSGRKRNPSRTL